MEYEKIKQLMDDMGNSKLFSLKIDFPDGTKISMKKEPSVVIDDKIANVVTETKIVNSTKTVEEVGVLVEKNDDNFNIIKSPMVGTFYLKPSPSAAPYVEIGKSVKCGDIVCIVEAMKLMNEIESEFDGEIVEILVKDGSPVEYGMPLFRVR